MKKEAMPSPTKGDALYNNVDGTSWIFDHVLSNEDVDALKMGQLDKEWAKVFSKDDGRTDILDMQYLYPEESEVVRLLKKDRAGQKILNELNRLDDAQLALKVRDIVGDDKKFDAWFWKNVYFPTRTIVAGKVNSIRFDFYDSLVITSDGVTKQYEHGMRETVVEFNQYFALGDMPAMTRSWSDEDVIRAYFLGMIDNSEMGDGTKEAIAKMKASDGGKHILERVHNP